MRLWEFIDGLSQEAGKVSQGGKSPLEVESRWDLGGQRAVLPADPGQKGEVQREVLSPRACLRAMGRKELNAG